MILVVLIRISGSLTIFKSLLSVELTYETKLCLKLKVKKSIYVFIQYTNSIIFSPFYPMNLTSTPLVPWPVDYFSNKCNFTTYLNFILISGNLDITIFPKETNLDVVFCFILTHMGYNV